MDVKAGVRERRQNRIRAIQSRLEAGRPAQNGLPQPIDEQPYRRELPAQAAGAGNGALQDLDNDPESAWRKKESQLLSDWQGGGGASGGGPGLMPSKRQLGIQLLFCILLYLLIFSVFQLQNDWAAQAKRYVRTALTQDMQVDTIEAWYRQTFSGAPSLIPAFLSKYKDRADKVIAPASKSLHTPVKGVVTAAFAAGHSYVEWKVSADTPVAAMDTGMIVSAVQQDGAGYTVTIRHAGGLQSTYSGLKPGTWEKDDWVNGGDIIGYVAAQKDGSGVLKFAVLKDKEFINPADVVSLD